MQTNSIAQTYNDGRISLKVWVHKVWSNANCGEIGNQEYVIKNIQARVLGSGGNYITSPSGNMITFDGDNNRYWNASGGGAFTASGFPFGGYDAAGFGYKLLDVNYTSTEAPFAFDVIIGQAYEDDCDGTLLSCNQGSRALYDKCCCVNLPLIGTVCAQSDEYQGTSSWTGVNFRGGEPGIVNYSQPIIVNPEDEHAYTVVFSYRWDWIDPLLPTCPTPKYADGPITLSLDLVGAFLDSDWDGGFGCGTGVAGAEDIRIKLQATDNITPAFVPFSTANGSSIKISQNKPQWNTSSSYWNKTWNYGAGATNMESMNIAWDMWEEDGFYLSILGLGLSCGTDDNYEGTDGMPAWYCVNSDDAHSTTIPPNGSGKFDYATVPNIGKTINWRNSPPNTDNYIDIPVNLSTSQYRSWMLRFKYKWTIANPVISSINQPDDNTLCIGSPALTFTATTTNATYYQWQVADVSGGTPPTCPASANWTDIPGETCKTFTAPQTPGTRIYRLVAFNRNGTGSTGNTGPRYATAISNCKRVTYFGYAPPIVSTVCGTTVTQGSSSLVFTVDQVPTLTGVANATSYTWSISGPGCPGANCPTILTSPGANGSATATTATVSVPANAAVGTYTITMTTTGCGSNLSATKTCQFNVATSTCDIIHVAPPASGGNDANSGSVSAPMATIQAALNSANSTGRKHIKILNGTYASAKLIIPGNDIILDGDYQISGSDWEKSSALATIVNLTPTVETLAYDGASGTQVGVYKGVEAVSRTGFQMYDLDFNVMNATSGTLASGTTGNRGRSVYGFYFRNCNTYKIERCTMNAGQGSAGVNGVNGSPGANGSNGSNGAGGACDNQDNVGDGGAGGNGAGYSGGNGVGAGANVDNSCCNVGQTGGTGAAGSGSRNGGGGGAGGSGGSERNTGGAGGNGGVSGAGNSAGTANGAGGNNGQGCCGFIGCTGCSQDCDRDGRKGANGANGTAGGNASATPPATSTTYSHYWLPNAQSANGSADGTGGGGGKGGGGGAGQGGCCALYDGGGSGGGGGGGGGQGGTLGTGGWGSGSSFALYAYGAGTGTLINVTLTAGAFRAGGTLGTGGSGGNGGTGGCGGNGNNTSLTGANVLSGGVDGTSGCPTGRTCGNCEVGAGGQGGRGGNGGKGGNGQPGANGLSIASNAQGSAVVNSSNNGLIAGTTTVKYNKGCTNSIIPISKTTGANWLNLGSGGAIVNDVDATTSSFTMASNALDIYYTTVISGNDAKDISVVGPQYYSDVIFVDQARNVPQIKVVPHAICSGEKDTFKLIASNNFTNASGTDADFEWSYRQYKINTTLIPGPFTWTTVTGAAPTPITFNNATSDSITYIVRFRTKDKCCGWSIYSYAEFVVYPAVTPHTTWTKNPNVSNICISNAASLTATAPTGASPSSGGVGASCNTIYRYTTDGGVTWTAWSSTLPTISKVIGTTMLVNAYECKGTIDCDTAFSTDTLKWIVDDTVQAIAAIVNIASCTNPGTATLAATTPAAGTGQWTYVSGTATTTPAVPTSSTTLNVSNIPLGTNTTTYRWTVTNGACSDFTNLNIVMPADSLNSISMDTLGCYTCSIQNGNTYYFHDYLGRIICKIQDLTGGPYSTGALGNTEVCLRIPTPNTSPVPLVNTINPVAGPMPYLGRYWSINPDVPNVHAKVTFYFTGNEYNKLKTGANSTRYSFNTATDLHVSKWPGGGGQFFNGPDNVKTQNNIPGGIMLPGGPSLGGNATWTNPTFAAYTTLYGGDYEVSFIVDTFSTFYVHPIIYAYEVLPVELVSFTGQNIGERNKLEWVTSTEINTNKFVVEKSINGTTWFYLGEVPAAGNSNATLNYQLFDETPVEGNNYYRLKIIDNDDSYKYSNVISINIQHNTQSNNVVAVYPNPVNEELNVLILSTEDRQINMNVYDILGQLISIQRVDISKGLNTVKLNTMSLSSATYILNFMLFDNVYNYKIVKN
ncbi:MAG TPA: T9SS type A sorting domain-containing protein [Chitinophagales bacterium]|nr:T9SS type A sorting domain-containing protein [Chitinophagales bacterium]